MNAIQLLKNEHEKAKRAFGEIQAANADQRAELWARLEPEQSAKRDGRDGALWSGGARGWIQNQKLKECQEHHFVEVLEAGALIQEIEVLDPTTDEWVEKVRSCKRHWSIASRKKKARRSSSTRGGRWRP